MYSLCILPTTYTRYQNYVVSCGPSGRISRSFRRVSYVSGTGALRQRQSLDSTISNATVRSTYDVRTAISSRKDGIYTRVAYIIQRGGGLR